MPNEYLKLEERLVLAAWVWEKLGYSSNKAMLEDLKDRSEGFDSSGESYVVQAILSLGAACKVSKSNLERYDSNIRSHLAYFNRHRKDLLTLRYFQHLSLLASELFLDQVFNHQKALRKELNDFVEQRNLKRVGSNAQDPDFSDADLTKCAYWMATGSGKTILMHFHYRQFLHYNSKPLDNILLVTPDERLSQQHIDQMEIDGIPCARFSLDDSGFEAVTQNTVRVIEITKFVQQKRGSGMSVPVEYFEGNNLIFVDEGHRGASSEAKKWSGYRAKLAETGFTFEYSATFGQAMTAARDDDMTKEYGKAILFDYSYKYFYGDGFGKDFEVLNLKQLTTEEQTRTLLLANLLAFHEQKRAFQTKSNAMLRYHLADPLWIFVGSTVNTNLQAQGSDVLTVVKFLDSFLRNRNGWVQRTIDMILSGQSGIEDESGHDVFVSRFKRLKAWSNDAESVLSDLLIRIFHASSGGRLHVGDIKGKAGELGLKVSGAEPYFGLVYIGDTASFKSLIETECPDVEVQEDQIAEGLFENIKRPDSPINVLIGAKKFMQGWDSWRVTNMGLLNIGRSEGSEIIQLFGRGVRLQGLNHSLKRSSGLPGEHPTGIELLEKLNIFAIRANYMTQFREYLEREGVDPTGEVELKLRIKLNKVFLKKGLIAPRLAKESAFANNERILLEPDAAAKVILDISTKVERLGSSTGALQSSKFAAGHQRTLTTDEMRWLNWERLYLDILEFKEERGFHNLLIRRELPRQILEATDPKLYGLICDDAFLKPERRDQVLRLQTTMSAVLKKYVESFYRKRQQRWDSSKMVYARLQKDDDNFQDYTIKVPRSNPDLIKTITAVIADGKRIYKELCANLPGVYLDRHLYQPLLVKKGSDVRTVPPALNDGETRFVNDLIRFCKSGDPMLKGKELFLLRNLSRGKGIGFFEDKGFYPDFIMWVTEGAKQRLIFIEPHGMLSDDDPAINPKVNLHQQLKIEAEPQLKKSGIKNLTLDSFVISVTPYDELRTRVVDEAGPWGREQFAAAHILFFDSLDYLRAIVTGQV
jgi:hypothetical protein